MKKELPKILMLPKELFDKNELPILPDQKVMLIRSERFKEEDYKDIIFEEIDEILWNTQYSKTKIMDVILIEFDATLLEYLILQGVPMELYHK